MTQRSLIFFLTLFFIFSFSQVSFVSAQSPTSTPPLDTIALIKQLQALVLSLQSQIQELRAKLETQEKELTIRPTD